MKEGTTLQNRYRLVRLLGQGSMGEVFLAEDLKRKISLALKIVKSHPKEAQFLRGEFQLLSHLSHPHLAQVYDFGFLPPQGCFYTMEYIEGHHLWSATQGMAPDEFYLWLVQLCRVLQYLNTKGYVHCDVKPSNVMVAQGQVKLMDFGLALGQNQSATGGLRGTLAYMAPEMAKGGRVDHRSDLYSLGALLYHTLTRRLPFEAKKTVELLRKHLETQPQSPSALVPSIPPLLEKIVLKLLAKEPGDRYQSANEVISAINQDLPSSIPTPFALETGETLRGRVSSSKLVGREEELQWFSHLLESRFDENSEEKGPPWIFLTGPEGIGKSRLLREFKWLAQLKAIRTLSLDLSLAVGSAVQSFEEILQELMGHREISSLPERFQPYLTKMLQSQTQDSEPPLREEKESLRFFFKLGEFLAWYSSQTPYVLVIDNFHFATKDFLKLVKYLGKFSEKSQLLIVCAFREDENFLDFLKSDSELERLTEVVGLKRLENYQVRALINSMFSLGHEDEKKLLSFLQPAGGTPLLIEELLKALLEGEVLLYCHEKWKLKTKKLADFEVPRELSHLFKQRFALLPVQGFELLKILAILARPASRDLLQKTTGVETIQEGLLALQKGHFLYEDFRKPGWFQLAHNRLSEVVVAGIEEEEKRELHKKIAQGLKQCYPEEEWPHGEMGLHFGLGGDSEKALQFLLLAAKKSKNVYSHHQSIFYYQSMLSWLSPHQEQWTQVMIELAQLYRLTGQLTQAVKTYGDLLELADLPPVEKGDILRLLGKIYHKLGNSSRACQYYRQGLEWIPDEEGDSRADLMASWAWDLALTGYFSEALEKIDRGFSLLQTKNSQAEASLFTSQMVVYYNQGNLELAAQGVQKALKIREHLDDDQGRALSLNNLGVILKEEGNFEEAHPCFDEALQMAKRIGDVLLIPSILNNLGSLLQEQGQFEEAFSLLKESLDQKLKLGNPSGIAVTLNNMGFLLFWQSQYGKALEYYNSSLKIQEELGSGQEVALTLNNLAALYLELAMTDEAGECLHRVEMLAENQNIAIQKAYYQRLRAQLDLVQGAISPAVQRLEDALNMAKEGNYINQVILIYLTYTEVFYKTREFSQARESLEKAGELAKKNNSPLLKIWISHLFSLLETQGASKLEGLLETEKLLQKVKIPHLFWKNQSALAREREDRGELEEALAHYQKALKTMKEIYQPLPRALKKAFVAHPERRQVRDNFIHLNSRILARESNFFFSDFSSLPAGGATQKPSPPLWGEVHSSLESYYQTVEIILTQLVSLGAVEGGALFGLEKNKIFLDGKKNLPAEEMEGMDIREKYSQLSLSPTLLSSPSNPKGLYLFPLYHLPSGEKHRLFGERRDFAQEAGQIQETGAILVKTTGPLSSEDVALIEDLCFHSSLALFNGRMFWEANKEKESLPWKKVFQKLNLFPDLWPKIHILLQGTQKMDPKDREDLFCALLARQEGGARSLPPHSYSRRILEELEENNSPLSQSASILKFIEEYSPGGKGPKGFSEEELGEGFRPFLE